MISMFFFFFFFTVSLKEECVYLCYHTYFKWPSSCGFSLFGSYVTNEWQLHITYIWCREIKCKIWGSPMWCKEYLVLMNVYFALRFDLIDYCKWWHKWDTNNNLPLKIITEYCCWSRVFCFVFVFLWLKTWIYELHNVQTSISLI